MNDCEIFKEIINDRNKSIEELEEIIEEKNKELFSYLEKLRERSIEIAETRKHLKEANEIVKRFSEIKMLDEANHLQIASINYL